MSDDSIQAATTAADDIVRVLSGMRPTGAMHLGHYHGALKNWLSLQQQYDCFFFVADWHALTTHYDDPSDMPSHVWDMVTDWLAVGINPKQSSIFIQSWIKEHAELHVLLSMITPLGWLERVPSYKDQQQNIKDKDLSTYGFLGYPLLQSADIMMYRAGGVPVGEDQVAHVEMTREIARRFNHLYGREPDFESRAEEAVKKLGAEETRTYKKLRKSYQETGDEQALVEARQLVLNHQSLPKAEAERLLGYLEGTGRAILREPQALLTTVPKVPGLDGGKMSKSTGNTIMLRETPDNVTQKVKTMPTDPARVRRKDPGNPEKCPVWDFHKIYSDEKTKDWVQNGCRSASIGCLECKQVVIDQVNAELAPIQEQAKKLDDDPQYVRSIVTEGCEKARDLARDTMKSVRRAMHLEY
ncbi:MAG: tryptophan--tRNA ligase [Gammaproteobacteria bacterium]|nr:tryptophan--tRNA ligase [Gammaproteobacteria bacterium]